ncbi:MAG: excinuclease ABC subunit UvrC [Patescibacteria group bacterium]
MKDKIKKIIKSLPNETGVYLFKNSNDRIIYVGKAISIKNRIKSHFQKPTELKNISMLEQIDNIEFIKTKSANEALILENNLIKLYHPYYNIKMRDDKNYPLIKLTNEDFPRIHIARKILSDGAKYFGPYTNASSMRQTIRVLQQVFGIRTCHIKHNHRPYSGYLIGKCTDACIGKVSKEVYAKQVARAIDFLSSKSQKTIRNLSREMNLASKNEEFELAKILRDQISILQRIKYQPDTFIFSSDNNESEKRLNMSALDQLKKELNLKSIPHRIECFDISNLGSTNIVGSMIVFTEGESDKSEYRKFKIKKVNIQNDVASMREILDRRFSRSSSVIASSSFCHRKESANRRTTKQSIIVIPDSKRSLHPNVIPDRKSEGQSGSGIHSKSEFWPLPDLILLDGGKGQLSAGKAILKKYDLNIPIAAMAKKIEFIFVPNSKEPIILPTLSPTLFLLQRIRNEAHRFAVTFQKSLRKPKSSLEEISGIGPKKRISLLQHFGSVENIKTASIEEIANTAHISIEKAKELISRLIT